MAHASVMAGGAPHNVQLADDGGDAAVRVKDGHAVHDLGCAVLANLQVVLPAPPGVPDFPCSHAVVLVDGQCGQQMIGMATKQRSMCHWPSRTT